MLERFIDSAVRNRLLVLLGLLASIGLTIMLIPRLNLDAFPDVTNIQVVVNTEAPGLAAEEVEQLITYPIEAVMYALPDVEEVRSTSSTGLSVVTVVFKDGTDLYFARQLVFERLQDAKERVPAGTGTPELGPNTSGLGQVFQYVLRADDPRRFDAMALRGLNDWVVKQLLAPTPGVTQILSFGGEVRQYQVDLDPNRLLAQGVTAAQVGTAIEENNRNAGGWYVERGSEQLVLRGVGWVRGDAAGLHDIAAIPVKSVDGAVVRVADVATVHFGAELRQGATTMARRDADGTVRRFGEVVTGIVLKRMGADTQSTIDGIKVRLPIVQQALPPGVHIEPFYDQAQLIDAAVRTVRNALLEAAALIAIVLLLFLLNVRATLLVLVSIPLSIGLALAVLALEKVSANLMSLGGLTIAIGMMVDGSVVMMENIHRRLSSGAATGSIAARVATAAREVGRPIFFAVLIVIVVFAPLFTLQGVEGRLFRPMALSITLAMLVSLLVALAVIPALSAWLFARGIPGHRELALLTRLDAFYRRLLEHSLGSWRRVLGGAAALLLGALALTPLLGTEFVPTLEEGTLGMRLTLAPSINLGESLQVAERTEGLLMQIPEISYVLDRIGRPELGGDPEEVSNHEWYIGVKPIEQWRTVHSRPELEALIAAKLAVFPGVAVSFGQPIATRVDELLSGVKAQLAIKLFGPDLGVLSERGQRIATLAANVAGTRDVAMEAMRGAAQLVVRPDRDTLARHGVAVADVMRLVSEEIGGHSAGEVIRGNERYAIQVRLAPEYRGSMAAIRALTLRSSNGAWLKLGDIASVAIESGPPQIRRDDVQRRVVIQANVEGRDMGSVVAELKRRIAAEVPLPPGYSVVYGGQFENQQRATQRLAIVVPVSLALIFLLLYFAFGSSLQAAIVMLNVPLALIGGILALLFSRQYLSVPGSIGFIALFGVAVLNGVVLIAAINQRIAEHQALRTAVIEGATSRLRPVLMTAAITALGLMPMLLARGIGSEIQRPLATVVVGGLFSSTLLTLLVLPTVYALLGSRVSRHDAQARSSDHHP